MIGSYTVERLPRGRTVLAETVVKTFVIVIMQGSSTYNQHINFVKIAQHYWRNDEIAHKLVGRPLCWLLAFLLDILGRTSPNGYLKRPVVYLLLRMHERALRRIEHVLDQFD